MSGNTSDLKGTGGELRATVHITRKDTGEVETYEVVGHTTPEQHVQITHPHHGTSGALAGQACTNEEP